MCTLVILIAVSPSHAETVEEQAARLFDEGAGFRAQGDYERSCPRFAQSFELVPAPGTAFDLAECMEHDRHYLRAWELYRVSAEAWDRAEKGKLAAIARERSDLLLDKLGEIVVDIADPSLAGMIVTVGDRRVDPAPEIRQRVEPGAVKVTASAPDGRMFTSLVQVAPGTTMTVAVPRLGLGSPSSGARRRSRVFAAIGLGIVGTGGLVSGGLVFLDARARYHSSGGDATMEASARREADVATGLGVLGLAGAIAAAYVFLTAPRDIVVAPVASVDSAGLALHAWF